MPENYEHTLKELLSLCHDSIAGFVVINNLNSKTVKSGAGLFFCGARRTGLTMFKNIFKLPLKRRQKLFTDLGLPVLYENTMNSASMISYIKENKIDLIINMRTRCIYKKKVLRTPLIGCINIHHGLLPTYRGTLCDLYALFEGRDAGFSIHEMTLKVDDGKILSVQKVSRGDKNYQDYLRKTAKFEAKALAEIIKYAKKNRSLPDGIVNYSDESFYRKTPGPKEIREFVKAGMIL
jgi:methionyl-tRNA formyltransferase